MDTAQWHQEIVLKPMEEIIVPNTNNSTTCSSKPCVERKVRPQKDQALNCPRCNSTNTKFCYYNNYSLSQPRYFCKTCRRYWTEGGSLRSIPVGGGSRKNKRSSSSSSSTTSCSSTSSNINMINPLKNLPDLVLHQNPSTKIHEDLNLGFASDFKTISELIQVPNYDNNNNNKDNNNSTTSTMSSLELITGMTTRGLSNNNNNINSFMPMPIISDHPNSVYNTSHGFSMPHEFKPSLNFSLDHGLGPGGAYGNHHHLQDTTTSSRLLFNFDGLKQVSSTTTTTTTTDHHGVDHHQHNRDQPSGDQSTGFWNGMLGGRGGGSW